MNNIFENFLKELAMAASFEEKEYAMINAYDAMEEAGYTNDEMKFAWNEMLLKA